VNLSGKNVFVTGAGGFIASHVADKLVGEGARVRALVHYNAMGRRGWLDKSPLGEHMDVIAGDINDFDSLRSAMVDAEIVFHLAALTTIPYSYRAPGSYLSVNVCGTLNVLQAARELGVKRIVHVSTSEVYGTAQYLPVDEKHPLHSQSPYSASKVGAEKMAEAFYYSFAVPVVMIRLFNTFGPRQSARAIIPTIVAQCLSGKESISLGNLSPTRDMNYVSNTVDALLAAAEADQAVGQAINVGSGREISVGDLARLIMKLTGTKAAIKSETERMRPANSEVNRLYCDSSLARRLLGWEPKVDLEEGLQRTIDWIRENMESYCPKAYGI
jgi:NAD dependent epimerase/dehydratase